MTSLGNDYCERLNLPIPRVEDFLGAGEAKLFHLLVVALLEHGKPMEWEAIAERLEAAGVQASTGDMVYSLQKAWHGLLPVFRDRDGRLALDLQSDELERLLFQLELRYPSPELTVPPPEPEPVPDHVPLTEVEVRAAFHGSSQTSVSTLRQVAAILDARGGTMSLADVEEYLSDLTSFRDLTPTDLRRWTRTCVQMSSDGFLRLDCNSPDVPAMRRAIRKLARPKLIQEARDQHWKRLFQEREIVFSQRLEQEQRIAKGLRRAVVRVVPGRGPPKAAALLDVGARSVRTFVGNELAQLRSLLDGFNLVAALGARETLYALDVPDVDRWRFVDLKPPQKSRRLNRQGRTLSITPQLLITSTTGISRPLGDKEKVAGYLASGDLTKLRRRIESDVKALFAFYNYGVLHGCVRLRWGFLDESLPVSWASPGDPSLYEILKNCQASGMSVDLVTGSAPGWSDPWSRAIRVRIQSIDFASVTVQCNSGQWHVPRYEIQAARPVDEEPHPGNLPLHPSAEH